MKKYKKLPEVTRKYNEAYYDGLYWFEDVPNVLVIGVDNQEGEFFNKTSENLENEELYNNDNYLKDCTDKLRAAGKLHKFGAIGRWTNEEHDRFVEGLRRFGKDWIKIEYFLKTRSCA